MKNHNIIIVLALICFTFFSCTKDDESTTGDLPLIQVSTGELYPEFNPEIFDYYITSLNTLNEIEVTLNDFNPFKKIFINNEKVTGKTTPIKLTPGEDIVIQMESPTAKTYTIHYLPEDMPGINLIAKNNPSDGYLFINLYKLSPSAADDFTYIAILDNNGFPVYYKKLAYTGAINFKFFETVQGKRFTYTINDTKKTVVMDENFEVIKQIDFLPPDNAYDYSIENHDFIYIDDDHYIVPGQYIRENVDMTAYGGSNAVKLVEFVFQEVLNNQVIFEWDTAEHPELLSATDPLYYTQYATAEKVDYFHFNSIAIDPNDENFIVSARHTNQVYKINRTTGEIMWRLGGNNDDFNLTGNTIISHQHHANILNNGNLLLFDNGVTKNPQQSRIAEFELNETNLTANLVYEYTELGRYSDIMGSVQKLSNGNYCIGWGGNITSQSNANKSDITEVDPNGTIVLDISFTNYPDSFTYSYRALKYNLTFNSDQNVQSSN